MKLSEENPHKYFVLSRYSHKSQQYGIFVVSEVGKLDMEAKTRKIVFSGKKLMLAANNSKQRKTVVALSKILVELRFCSIPGECGVIRNRSLYGKI